MKVNNDKFFDTNKQVSSTTYRETMERFNEILNSKLNINQNKAVNKKSPSLETIAKPQNRLIYANEANSISENVRLASLDAANKINKYFKDSPMKNLGKDFEQAEKKYGVNAFFLSALAALESAKGSSRIAKDKNNLFGFGAYDSDPYKYAKEFSDFQESIDKVASYISKEYLSEDGNYYQGNSIEDINKNYASDKNWHKKIKDIIGEILDE